MYETDLAALNTTPSAIGIIASSLADASQDQADLLAFASPPDEPVAGDAPNSDPFGKLIDLMLIAERGSVTSSPVNFEGEFASSLLRLLTHERLLGLVETLIFRARPRYIERTETLAVPRGRLHDKSLLFAMSTGTPRVEATFDELTIDTPLLQVVARALRVIATDVLPRKVAALRPGNQTRAVQLIRHLSGVALIDRDQALLTAERLWLSPLDSIWKPAIDAAIPVLRDFAVKPENGVDAADAILVHISTEKFWEQCVELALESAFSGLAAGRNGHQGDGVSVPAPWLLPAATDGTPIHPSTASFPDFMFSIGQRVLVADAKYKLGFENVLSAADGYQMFAYSHLASLRGRTSDAAVLFYPVRAGSRPRQMHRVRLYDRTYPLWLSYLPFPTHADLRNATNWGAYVAELGSTIRDFSIEWVVVPDRQPS